MKGGGATEGFCPVAGPTLPTKGNSRGPGWGLTVEAKQVLLPLARTIRLHNGHGEAVG